MDAVLTPPRHFSVSNLTSKCVWSSLLLHNPRRALRSLSATLLLLFLSVLCVRTPLPVAGQPNLILIVRDDQKTDTLAFMPNVRRLLVDGGTSEYGGTDAAVEVVRLLRRGESSVGLTPAPAP